MTRPSTFSDKEQWSGRLELLGDQLVYTSPHAPGWSLNLGEIRLIAEETIEALGDDWFIHFAVGSEWRVCPVYAAGFLEEVWQRLRERFGCDDLRLSNSISFKSRILWPPSLRDRPLFDYEPERSPPLWRWLTRSERIESTLTVQVLQYLRQTEGQGGYDRP